MKVAIKDVPKASLASSLSAEFIYGTLVEDKWDVMNARSIYRVNLFRDAGCFDVPADRYEILSQPDSTAIPMRAIWGLG